MQTHKILIFPAIVLSMLVSILFLSCSRGDAFSEGSSSGVVVPGVTASSAVGSDIAASGIVASGDSISGMTASDVRYSFSDALGREVALNGRPRRVVSLLGSYAETWLLAGGELVGVTDDVISERHLDVPDGTIIIGTVKNPNLEKLLELDPDFVLLSPDVQGHVAAARILEQAKIPCAYFKVEQFDDYLRMLGVCTDITGRKDLYERHGLAVQRRIEAILDKALVTTESSSDTGRKPTVLFVRALSGKAKAKADDNMTCRMLEDLGTDNIAKRHASLLDELTLEAIIAEDPDYIFVVPMGDADKALKSMHDIFELNPAWAGLSAVKEGRYVVLPKDLFHYKPNARWAESYEYLAGIIYG